MNVLLYDNPATPIAVSYLPLMDLGTDTRQWCRETPAGGVQLDASREAGLPCGALGRCILYWLNARARVCESPRVRLERSFSTFMQQLCAVGPDAVNDQLERICAVQLTTRVGPADGEHVSGEGLIVQSLRRRGEAGAAASAPIVQLEFSDDYFTWLMKRGVALEPAAVLECASDALALDLYAWFAATLAEVPEGKEALVSWEVLIALLGPPGEALPAFRQRLTQALTLVTATCPGAKVTLTAQGLAAQRSAVQAQAPV